MPAAQKRILPDRSGPRPSYVSSSPRDCFQIFFVHIEKTGGTTVRHLFEKQARKEGIEYYMQGYLKRGNDLRTPCEGRKGWYARHCCTWQRLMSDLKANMTSHPRLFVEVRGSRLAVEKAMEDLRYLRERNGDQCPLIIFTLLREPHRQLVSFYRYFTLVDQTRRTQSFGKSFAEWIPFNMQSEILVGNDVGFKALYNKQGRPQDRRDRGKDPATFEDAAAVLDGMDLVGVTRLFNALILRLSDLTGISHIRYEVANMARGKKFNDIASVNYENLAPKKVEGAPPPLPPDEARALIANHTEIDKRLFEEYERRFEKQIAALGDDFKERLDAYEEELLSAQRKRPAKAMWGGQGGFRHLAAPASEHQSLSN